MDDTNYIDLYTEYRRMLENREKVSYIVAALAVKYAIKWNEKYMASSSDFKQTATCLQCNQYIRLCL